MSDRQQQFEDIYHPPSYQALYGFKNGAQMDLYDGIGATQPSGNKPGVPAPKSGSPPPPASSSVPAPPQEEKAKKRKIQNEAAAGETSSGTAGYVNACNYPGEFS